ncbi:MAG: hypothetical protein QM656_06570 [Paracoccaceae bacterium]
MRHDSFGEFLDRHPPARGPVALILAEDSVEVDSTLRHHLKAGFAQVLLLAPPVIEVDPQIEALVHRIDHDVHAEGAMVAAVNRLIASAAPETWIYYCFNAEYLFHPFCETRNIREMCAFQAEERRDAFLSYVIDLYAGDLACFPDAVSLETAMMDRSGYYSLSREDAADNYRPRDRQMDFFGGLRWRFEEHVPWDRRKIDRIALFRTRPGLELRPDFTFDDQEYNTYACPWHNNITTAVMSFRTAKALRSNPGSREAIRNFRWHGSATFNWQSQQLMDLGLMEPGQWF